MSILFTKKNINKWRWQKIQHKTNSRDVIYNDHDDVMYMRQYFNSLEPRIQKAWVSSATIRWNVATTSSWLYQQRRRPTAVIRTSAKTDFGMEEMCSRFITHFLISLPKRLSLISGLYGHFLSQPPLALFVWQSLNRRVFTSLSLNVIENEM